LHQLANHSIAPNYPLSKFTQEKSPDTVTQIKRSLILLALSHYSEIKILFRLNEFSLVRKFILFFIRKVMDFPVENREGRGF
jgi:hypothetical protein